MSKITYFDVEYANNKNKSICQIGVVCEDLETGEPYYPELDMYINPEDGFDDNCTRIHNIFPETVADSPNFPEAWKTLERYFAKAIIVGHNVASSDLNALMRALSRYNIDLPELYYICTYDLSREFVPSFSVSDYSLSTLCRHFDIDMDSEHNAFDDACACADLFKELIKTYHIDVEEKVKKFIPQQAKEHTDFLANPMLRKSVNEFYGVICGFIIDSKITDEESSYIRKWRDEHLKYSHYEQIGAIIHGIDEILLDGVITLEEATQLRDVVAAYIDTVSNSMVTLSTQVLDGILKGISADGEVSEKECKMLQQWLYDCSYLSNHYPFDKITKLLEDVLADSIVTKEESEFLQKTIDELLNPVETTKVKIYGVEGKQVCLSGNFAFGKKAEVEAFIVEKGGTVTGTITRKTDMLIIGEYECQSYSNMHYGTKVKKAMEYNTNGCNIQIVKEKDFFASV